MLPPMNEVVILWIYIVLLELGGLMGLIKAGSKASIIASTIFAVILVMFTMGIFPFQHHVWVLLFLVLFFGLRWAKSKKMMPNGMMAILTIATLAAIQYIKHK